KRSSYAAITNTIKPFWSTSPTDQTTSWYWTLNRTNCGQTSQAFCTQNRPMFPFRTQIRVGPFGSSLAGLREREGSWEDVWDCARSFRPLNFFSSHATSKHYTLCIAAPDSG